MGQNNVTDRTLRGFVKMCNVVDWFCHFSCEAVFKSDHKLS